MRLRSLELGECEIGTMVAITPLSFTHWIGKRSADVWRHVCSRYRILVRLANRFVNTCRLPVTYPNRTGSLSSTSKHSDVFVMSLEFARVREQHNCSLDVLLEVGA
jgi:hypothetical protein